MPTPGDVDVVMAAELMEAGRSVLRGLVTPDKTSSSPRPIALMRWRRREAGRRRRRSIHGRRCARFRRSADHRLRHGEACGRTRHNDLGARCSARSPVRARCRSSGRPTKTSCAKARAAANASLAAFADAYDRSRAGERRRRRPALKSAWTNCRRMRAIPSSTASSAACARNCRKAPARWLSRG